MNRDVTILSLKDVVWLEDARLIFLIFHTFVCKFDLVDAVRGKKNKDQCMGKLTERLLAQLRASNFVNTVSYLVW